MPQLNDMRTEVLIDGALFVDKPDRFMVEH